MELYRHSVGFFFSSFYCQINTLSLSRAQKHSHSLVFKNQTMGSQKQTVLVFFYFFFTRFNPIFSWWTTGSGSKGQMVNMLDGITPGSVRVKAFLKGGCWSERER